MHRGFSAPDRVPPDLLSVHTAEPQQAALFGAHHDLVVTDHGSQGDPFRKGRLPDGFTATRVEADQAVFTQRFRVLAPAHHQEDLVKDCSRIRVNVFEAAHPVGTF